MSRSDPSVLALASKLRGVSFHDVECQSVEGKGWGLTTTADLTSIDENIDNLPKLITIPHDLVLNQQTVEEYAKESREFRELYEAVGRQVRNHAYSLLSHHAPVFLTCYRALISDLAHDSLRGEMSFYSCWCN
jgi:hypothetical protein